MQAKEFGQLKRKRPSILTISENGGQPQDSDDYRQKFSGSDEVHLRIPATTASREAKCIQKPGNGRHPSLRRAKAGNTAHCLHSSNCHQFRADNIELPRRGRCRGHLAIETGIRSAPDAPILRFPPRNIREKLKARKFNVYVRHIYFKTNPLKSDFD